MEIFVGGDCAGGVWERRRVGGIEESEEWRGRVVANT